MESFKKVSNIAGWSVFVITAIVYYLTAERVGSLWDCGEFILGAYKLEVVHPPGAPLFILVGRIFTWFAEILSDDPADIAFAVNLMSGLCTAGAAMFAAWITMIFGKLAVSDREDKIDQGLGLALIGAGLCGGLISAFCTSVWFSAVEGEVYAMSTFFTMLTLWCAVKWFYLPDEKDSDRWLVMSLFAGGLSVGVHLLSILTFPAIALLYYFKKHKNHTLVGYGLSLLAGVVGVAFLQKFIIVGIPSLWKNMELFMVNGLGLPFHSGLIPTIAIIAGVSYGLLRLAKRKRWYLLHLLTVSSILITVAFSTFGTIVLRANADTPVNMNVPSDAMRLLPYLNREQYGERPLLKGPHYLAQPKSVKREERYGRVGDRYEVVDEKFSYEYNSKDEILFPRIGHSDPGRQQLHRQWKEATTGRANGTPTMGYNLKFLFKYQLDWMYWRYFMWNFVGRQNGEQGYFPWDVKSGHWSSGINAFDSGKLYNMDKITDVMKRDQANNGYFFLPLIFGLLGLFFHFRKDKKGFMTMLITFVITGIGIIIYSNQPPNEPRERDYVLVGSFITFAMWGGMAVLALYELLKEKANLKGITPAAIATALVLTAPIIMASQNWDDHDRSEHQASRDYAANFLNSVAENAIIFTYGDNDTYPLWYAQEVENIRRDVRVVNLSLIAVDWYINKLRNKLNDSPPINLTIDADEYRGKNRNQVFFYNPRDERNETGLLNKPISAKEALRIIKDKNNGVNGSTIVPSKNIQLNLDWNRYRQSPGFIQGDSATMVDKLRFRFSNDKYITKDELAVFDLIVSNIYDRPIYFATTCKNEKLLGLNRYMNGEGLALRVTGYDNGQERGFPTVYGSGKVDVNRGYDIIMNKWKWGNFDTKELYVDKSYGAEVQAMKLMMLRTASNLSQQGDDARAADIAKKYFEGFPHMNFPYEASVMPFINILIRAGEFDEAKKHMRILANHSAQQMEFYNSIDDDDLASFQQEMSFAMSAINDINRVASQVQDPDFANEMTNLLSPYLSGQLRN
jgi:hypothetical protein